MKGYKIKIEPLVNEVKIYETQTKKPSQNRFALNESVIYPSDIQIYSAIINLKITVKGIRPSKINTPVTFSSEL
ncbi:hypothetical protein AYI68_g2495 [Smittium mucronatum]|uniref:Uncharacterized protein n=1 Tax=Smittium mucronatum TaxID=133383 RepID=A0A1R0H2I0_9FUNG|nr:hypothetical protein AYI68_g2495 [Smittium mucronatum]